MRISTTFFFLLLLSSLSAQNRERQKPTDEFQSSIAVSDSGVQRLILWMDELEVQINAEVPRKGMTAQTSNLNLSKSNINKTKSGVKNVSIALAKLKGSVAEKHSAELADLKKAITDLESPIQDLYNSLLSLGGNYTAKAAELKTKHDTVKNSIGNIR